MHFPSSTVLLSALLAGQFASAAYIPLQSRAEIIRTEVRTVYSTKVVYASPSSAGTNSTDGLPLAPSISNLSIPLSSIVGVNPINGLPVPTVKKTTISKKPASTKTPTSTKKPTLTKKPTSTKVPAANSSAAAAIASMLAQRPKQSSTRSAAAGIASILVQLPKATTSSAAGIVIVPVTLKTVTVKPKTTTAKQPTLQTDSSPTPVPNGREKAMSLLAALDAAQS